MNRLDACYAMAYLPVSLCMFFFLAVQMHSKCIPPVIGECNIITPLFGI